MDAKPKSKFKKLLLPLGAIALGFVLFSAFRSVKKISSNTVQYKSYPKGMEGTTARPTQATGKDGKIVAIQAATKLQVYGLYPENGLLETDKGLIPAKDVILNASQNTTVNNQVVNNNNSNQA